MTANLPARDILVHLTHELRQPLSAIESMAFYLRMTAGQHDAAIGAQADRMRQMVDSASWMLTDILHLLQASRVRAAEFPLADLVEEILAETGITDGLAVVRQENDPLPLAWADVCQIGHLLRGVLHFLRRTADASQTTVSLARSGSGLAVSFVACAPNVDMRSLFEPLAPHQLATCRSIADANGGAFTVDKDSHGWLTIMLKLPAAAPVSPAP